MAVLTNIRGLQMRGILTGCICAVMAAGTIAGDVDVIEVGGSPAGG